MVMQEQAPPTDTEAEEPTETEGPVDGDGDATEETQSESIDDLLERFKPEELTSHPSIKAQIEAEVRRAEDRTRNKLAAESRRKYGDPRVVRDNALAILKESGLDDLSRSQEDRLNTLISTFEQQAAQKVAGEIPGVFFGNYKFSEDVLETYHEKVAESDYDGAFQALVDGAVALKTSTLEGEFEKRVESEVKKRVKAELEASNTNGTKPLPNTSRGVSANGVSRSLTTAEIEKFPASIWRKLPDDVKDEIKANVGNADQERGAQTVEVARLEQLASLAK